jgi:phosphoglycerate dehydrogenase-like enzyme
MAHLLTNQEFVRDYGTRLRAVVAQHGLVLEPLLLPADPQQRLDAVALSSIEVGCFTGNFEDDPAFARRFLGSALRAPNLRWLHLPNAGVDHPVFGRLRAHGVRLTTSSGAAAEPAAQAAIAGLLALARGFPRWSAAQRRHAWAPHPVGHRPRDLRGQTVVLLGVGAIGNEIGRLAQALGLHVIGIRRRPRTVQDHVDAMHPPAALADLLPGADWLVLACPLTAETRGLIDAAALACLPPGACVINIARGQVIEEPALIDALRRGHVGGAYLDVFVEEPLPADSPLWDMPNVILSPHDAGAATGNAGRVSELFLRNLERWVRGEALENEVQDSSP